MAISLEEKLRKKGWSEDEIKQATKIMYNQDQPSNTAQFRKGINPFLYWMGIIIAIIGNMVIAVILIPMILVLSSTVLYIIIGIIGLGFGGMFYFLLNDLEHVSPEHHVVGGVFMPAIALITIYVMVDIVKYLAKVININVTSNSIIISLIYVITFTAPYAIGKLSENAQMKKIQQRQAAK